MRIRLWNAFASNNSGSYTIVGNFSDAATAIAVAQELAELCRAETEWLEAEASNGPEPITEFARRHGLAEYSVQDGDEWPEYNVDISPRVVAVGRQLVLHHSYTVTLPRIFGEHIYKRGGRVELEIEHGHEPLIVEAEVWARTWKDADEDVRARHLQHELHEPDGVLKRISRDGVPPVVMKTSEPTKPRLRLLFVPADDDLVEAVEALGALVRKHRLEMNVRLREAEERDDPLRLWRAR